MIKANKKRAFITLSSVQFLTKSISFGCHVEILICGPDNQIALFDEPVMKLVCRMNAAGLADVPDFLIAFRAGHLSVQHNLDRAFDVLAVLSAPVIDISLDRPPFSSLKRSNTQINLSATRAGM